MPSSWSRRAISFSDKPHGRDAPLSLRVSRKAACLESRSSFATTRQAPVSRQHFKPLPSSGRSFRLPVSTSMYSGAIIRPCCESNAKLFQKLRAPRQAHIDKG